MRLVVFDCDGTLVDSQHIIFLAMSSAFERVGLAKPEKEIVRSVIGLSLVQAVEKCLPHQDAGDPQRIAELYKNAFADLRTDPANDEPLFDGTREVLQNFLDCPNTLLAVATGKSQRGVDRLFEREGLAGFFQSVQTADTHPSKPHPSMLAKAMAETGTDAANTVMVGDTTYDMAMAVNAGVQGVGVTWGYHDTSELTASGASSVISHFDALPAAVDTVLATRAAS